MTRADAERVLLDAGMPQDRVDAFIAWHTLHPQAWGEFEREMVERLKGLERMSAKAVFEDIRKRLGKDACKYSLDNRWHGAFGHLFAAKHGCKGRIELRRLGPAV